MKQAYYVYFNDGYSARMAGPLSRDQVLGPDEVLCYMETDEGRKVAGRLLERQKIGEVVCLAGFAGDMTIFCCKGD